MFLFVLIAISIGVIGYETANSELAYMVKQLFGLHKKQENVQVLSYLSFYKKFLDKLFVPLLPFSLILICFARFYNFLFKLLQCPYCTSFWITLSVIFFLPQVFILDITLQILLPFISMFACSIYSKIRE